MRYFLELSYNGASYKGWQRQPHATTLQQVIEEALEVILRMPTPVVGCGRTDTGVHASQYYLHFDYDQELPQHFLNRLNKVLPLAISVHQVILVPSECHARFDATKRSYQYHLDFFKNPYAPDTRYFFPQHHKLQIDKMKEAAALLKDYTAFYPFCKSNTDVKTMNCDIFEAKWVEKADHTGLVFHISANRFLRGMVRLIVGMSLNVGLKKLNIQTVKNALDTQERLTKSLSAPPHGLFLTRIEYDQHPIITSKSPFVSISK